MVELTKTIPNSLCNLPIDKSGKVWYDMGTIKEEVSPMEKKIRKITLEWESAEVPEWLENLACDNRCLSFGMKEAVTEREWHELIQNKATRLICEQSWLKEFPDKALDFAEKFVECMYYIE